MRHLPNIARLTKRLGVLPFVSAAAHNGNDVVKDKFFYRPAPCTSRVFPVASLGNRKVTAISQEFSRFEWMSKGRNHFVPVLGPTSFECFRDFCTSFRRVFVAFGWACLFTAWSSSYGVAHPFPSFLGMGATPKGIIFAHHGFADAFPVLTGHASVFPQQVVFASVMQRSANAARDHLSGSLVWHGNTYNGVKSVETPVYAFGRIGAIPSQAMQECIEGVTTRAWSPERTVKPHERPARKGRDSLSYTETYRNADKEPRDNNTDEVLNINPNSPISAAQFSITQYAAAVSMSGLEMLQNSGKEAIIDLLEGRHKVAEAQLMNRIDNDIYLDGTGNSGKNITGLASALTTAGTGTYGGIARATWAFWSNQYYRGVTDGGAAVSASNIQQYMTTLALRCVRGSSKPDLWVASSDYYAFYVNSLQAIQRITSDSGSGTAGAGFGPELKFYGGGMSADVVLGGGVSGVVSATASANTNSTSSGAPTSNMYAINTDYLFFRPHRDRNFVPIGGERQSVNQDAVVKLIGWAGNLTSSGPQFCGRLSA